MAARPPALIRHFALGFGAAGLAIPLLVEAAWLLGVTDRLLPYELLDWLILLWPWSTFLIDVEEAQLPLYLAVLAITAVLNVLLYAALGALVGALVRLVSRRP